MADVQNTLTVNALLQYSKNARKQHHLPRIVTDLVCFYALSEASSGSDAFDSQQRPAKMVSTTFSMEASYGYQTLLKQLFIVFTTVDSLLGYKRITTFLVTRILRASRSSQG
ncbi:alkylation response protein AidB-like acyl-CoA dehydrogenase [Edaphobacter lichenicola]|uniref:Alkylation response protein AidB-like acyl-CoA dehydrogenase n=1 Tax=Tunturiibacter lichenicola TaxID=2051959 RepID=A0A852VSH1_9BACT|nr:alkylation response protein AidB-like acyl-CoA dehydrogenase [Edaphobacter lichenicola]